MGHYRPLFLYFRLSYKQLTVNMFYKSCQWLVSNLGPLVSKATTLSTVPQPLPDFTCHVVFRITMAATVSSLRDILLNVLPPKVLIDRQSEMPILPDELLQRLRKATTREEGILIAEEAKKIMVISISTGFLNGSSLPLFHLISSYSTNITICTTNKWGKCPFSIWCWDSNPHLWYMSLLP